MASKTNGDIYVLDQKRFIQYIVNMCVALTQTSWSVFGQHSLHFLSRCDNNSNNRCDIDVYTGL